MGFKKTELTNEEKNYIARFNIENPWNSDYGFNPISSVTDKERNMHLINVGYDHFGDWDEEYFILLWNDFVIVILFKLNCLDENNPLWDMISIKIPKEIEDNYAEIVVDLKDAMKVYGILG